MTAASLMRAVALLSCAGVAACAHDYAPGEGRVPRDPDTPFHVTGSVAVESAQTEQAPVRIELDLQMWAKLVGDKAVISQALAGQLKKAIDEQATGASAGPAKTIKVKVLTLRSNRAHNWMDYAVSLGGGTPSIMRMHYDHKPPLMGVVWEGMADGMVAAAVTGILNNQDVRTYLAQTGAAPPPRTVVAFRTDAGKATAPAAGTVDFDAKLRSLKKALDDGLITKEEYEAKRKQLLEGL